MISLAIQGGAMRSIYCLGAVRAIVECGYAASIRSIHVASAGCVSGAILAEQIADPDAPPIAETTGQLLDRLAGGKFINPRRVRKIVDVDYLVDTIREVNRLSVASLVEHDLSFEVCVTDAKLVEARYIDVSKCTTDDELYQALRATMALPLLFPKKVMIDGRRYIDGGISDPLPALHALERGPDVVIAISSVAKPNLGRELEGAETRLVRFVPGLSAALRHRLLGRNPLGAAVEELTDFENIGEIRIVKIAPVDQARLGHRLETDRGRLLALEELGYTDGMEAMLRLKKADLTG
jgi:predicted patatin/cPLA2 family phospholipase